MKKLLLVIAVLTLSVSAANATILWDQSAARADLFGYWNSNSPGFGFGATEIYGLNDFSLATDATITTVTEYYTNTGAWALGDYPAKFAIFAKTDAAPTNPPIDPLTAADVTVTVTDIGNQMLAVTLSGLNMALAAGDYWVLLSPIAPQGFTGTPEFQIYYDGATNGSQAYLMGIGGIGGGVWTPTSEAWDGAFMIEGEVVVSTEAASFGGVKSLYR